MNVREWEVGVSQDGHVGCRSGTGVVDFYLFGK